MSTHAIPVHVALVDVDRKIDQAELARVAGALNEQVTADFAPVWGVVATVGVYLVPPLATWRVELREGIGDPTAGGYHWSDHNQPYAEVDIGRPDWTVATSHEVLEMLADPWGNRLHTAAALSGWEGSERVSYLVEVCDPCERTAYLVGGVRVSDFLLPWYYRTSPQAVAGYSHTGAITQPLTVNEGGYISWLDPATGHMWQRFVHGGQTYDCDRGPWPSGTGSLREWIDAQARDFRQKNP